MKEKDNIKLSLKKEEEIKTSTSALSDTLPINLISEENSPFPLSPPQLESLVSKYTDSNDNNDVLNYIGSLGGTENILEKLKTSSEQGIKTEQFRKEYFGVNKVFEEPDTFSKFFERIFV